MKLKGVIPVIEVDNIERQLEFYQQAFRFIILNKRIGAHGMEWVHLKSDNTSLMLSQRNPSRDPPESRSGITLYYFTDDVVSSHRYMRARGIAVGELSATPYGMLEYLLQDPEGNQLAVGQNKKD